MLKRRRKEERSKRVKATTVMALPSVASTRTSSTGSFSGSNPDICLAEKKKEPAKCTNLFRSFMAL
jgi:hypothetical protein